MSTNSEQLSPAKALLVQWRALWAMAYVFAKTMTLAQYRDPRRAGEKAEMLEVWSRFALFTLIAQIAALQTKGKEDAQDIERLRAIVGALAMLCALAAKVNRECFERARFTVRMMMHKLEDHHALPRAITIDLGYLDSS